LASTSQRLFLVWRKFLMPSVFIISTRGQNFHSRAIPVALSPSFGSSTMAFRKELKKWLLCAAATYGMTLHVGRIFDVDNPITRFVIEGGKKLQSMTSPLVLKLMVES